MRIKVDSLIVKKSNCTKKIKGDTEVFRVRDLVFNFENSYSLEVTNDDSEILKCLKYCIKDNKNSIDYQEVSELIDNSNIIGNNFWSREHFERECKFEYKNYFDLENCEIKYE